MVKIKIAVARTRIVLSKLVFVVLGGVIGGSGVFIALEAPKLLEPQIWTFQRVPVVEAKELTIEEKIARTFPENPEVMIAVAHAESNMNPLATNRNTNGSRDIGLFQINSVHGNDDLEMFDVDKNLVAARKIYDKQGISAWYGFLNGGYKKFMK